MSSNVRAEVSEALIEFIERLFVGPVWPASVLVCLMILYTLVAMLGVIDLDLGSDAELDLDLDLDPDLGTPEIGGGDLGQPEMGGGGGPDFSANDDLLGGAGAATLRWTNLGQMPLIVWLSVFTVAYWAVSYGLWYGYDDYRYEPTFVTSVLLALRNLVIAVGLTKFATNPLKRVFQPAPAFGPSNLIGRYCVVSSGEADETFGQAKFQTDAAPLLLNIRTDGARYPKGTRVEIVAFDADQRIYQVSAASNESDS